MKKQRKGVALIWAMITSTVLLIVASTMANFIFKESGMSMKIDNSSAAYAAAKSGIEWGKYCVNNQGISGKDCGFTIPISGIIKGPYTISETTVPDTTYTVTLTDLTGGRVKIESVGEANGVRRKIEFVTQNEPWVNVTYPYSSVAINGSYTQQFDFWFSSIAPGDFSIGVGDAATDTGLTRNVAMSYTASNQTIKLVSKYPGDLKQTTDTISLASYASEFSRGYLFNATISYINNTSARLVISRRDASLNMTCVGSLVLDLSSPARTSNWVLSTNKIYTSRATATSTAGDGDSVVVTTAGDSVYIDNMVGKNIAATTSYTLTLKVTGGTITENNQARSVGPAGAFQQSSTFSYNSNNPVNITATPTAGFANTPTWSDNCAAGQSFTMTGNRTCTVSFPTNWVAGPIGGLQVYKEDINGLSWGPRNFCVAPQCSGGSPNNLVSPIANPTVDFSVYPAQNACKAVGGRLPTQTEMRDIIANSVAYFVTKLGSADRYWTSTEYSDTAANFIQGDTPLNNNAYAKDGTTGTIIRCVK